MSQSAALRNRNDELDATYKTMDQEARALLLELETGPDDPSLTRRVLLELAAWQRQALWNQIQAKENAETALSTSTALGDRLGQLEAFGVSQVVQEMVLGVVAEGIAQVVRERLLPILREQNAVALAMADSVKALRAHIHAINQERGQIEAEAPAGPDVAAAIDRLAGTIQDAVANLPKPEPRGGEIELIRDDRGNIIGARPKRPRSNA